MDSRRLHVTTDNDGWLILWCTSCYWSTAICGPGGGKNGVSLSDLGNGDQGTCNCVNLAQETENDEEECRHRLQRIKELITNKECLLPQIKAIVDECC